MRFIGITSVVSFCSCVSANTTSQPNIVFIMFDDLGWKDFGCYGSAFYETPNIDRLAAAGMMFTDAYAMPTSAPARASLMTGKYPPKTNVYSVDAYARTPLQMQKVVGIESKKYIDANEITIAEVLKQAGYSNGHFGKWHLGNNQETYPLNQGFDVNVAGCEAGSPKSYFAPFQNIKNILPQDTGIYLTDVLMEEALHFIDEYEQQPFFLYFPFYEVHVPIHAKKEWVEKYTDKMGDECGQHVREYAAMISYVDHCVGEIIKRLDELELLDKTAIFITSDNGGQIVATSNLPLRGQKGNLYEGGIRVPLIVHWPGMVNAGTIVNTPVSIIDFYPTLAEIARVSQLSPDDIDGESLVPIITQKEGLNRNAIFWHLTSYNGNGKANSKLWQFPGGAIRKGDWKLIENFEDGSVELFNLKEDIGETENVAGLYPDKTEDLLRDLKNWQVEYNAPIPSKLNDGYDANSKEIWKSKTNIRNQRELDRLIIVK